MNRKLIEDTSILRSAISDDQAREEFQRKNPKAKIRDRIVKFRSGRYQRAGSIT